MKITVAIENIIPFSSRLPLSGEHGVSFLIDTGRQRLLYDTGQTGAVVQNLMALGIDPRSIDAVVLSHGHYDHAGGLMAVLRATRPDVAVIAHPGIFRERYSVTPGSRRPIGVPFDQAFVRASAGQWRFHDEPAEIGPGVWFSGSIPRLTDFETGDTRLKAAGEGGDQPDPIEDDTVLYFPTERGLIAIGGCTHSGLVNAVRHGFAVTGCRRLRGWVGGTHLGPVSQDQQDRTIEQLRAFDPDVVAANHCTGLAMIGRLQQCFGSRFVAACTGETITFD